MMEMDPDVARSLFEKGGTLIAAGAPRGTHFGVDLQSWRIDSEFRGIKMIPPGLHFVHYSASDLSSGDSAPRMGFMHNFKEKEILVKLWDKDKENFSNAEVDEETAQRFRENLHNLDKFLAPYPYDILKKWTSLCSHITDALNDKLKPESGQIRSALELISCNDKDRPKAEKRIPEITNEEITGECSNESVKVLEKKIDSVGTSSENIVIESDNVSKRRTRTLTAEEKEEALLPDLKPTPGTSIRFTEFPDNRYPNGATPAEITKHHLDQSYVINLMMQSHDSPMDLLGELEFAYVCFLIGHSLDAFEHWKKLVSLFCSCEEAIKKHRNVYMNFITVLQVQLMEIPEEFLADIVVNQNIIYIMLRNFFKTVYNSDIESRLKTAIERFQFNLAEKFMWNFSHLEEDEDDELPVIVHL